MGLKKKAKEVIKESPALANEEEAIDAPDAIEDVKEIDGEDNPAFVPEVTYPGDFVYDVKIGRGSYENLDFEQLMLTLSGLTGKADKIVITRK